MFWERYIDCRGFVPGGTMLGVGKRAPRMAGPDIDMRGLATDFFIAEAGSGICDLVLANKSGGCIIERR